MPDDHREKAVEALAEKLDDYGFDVSPRILDEALSAAEPHLQRMFFERFREAMLSEEAVEEVSEILSDKPAINKDVTPQRMKGRAKRVLRAAFDKAQELMEADDG